MELYIKVRRGLQQSGYQHLRINDAETPRYSRDDGVDVEAAGWIAQIKNYAGTVGVNEVRELFGAAAQGGKQAAIFTSGRYSVEAVAFAEAVEMVLFVHDATAGTLSVQMNLVCVLDA